MRQELERKHGSDRETSELNLGEAELVRLAVETEALTEKPKKPKPLKPARSQAELTRVRQGYFLISLNCLNVCIGALIALKTFGII
jgi:hypothetical protein